MSIIYLKDGLMRFQSLDSYKQQNRTGKGKIFEGQIIGLKEEIDNAYFFTNKGRFMPELKFLNDDEYVVSISEIEKTLFLITKNGYAKRIQLKDINRPNMIMHLDDNDELVQVKATNGDDELLIITAQGQGLRVHEDEFPVVGKSAKGVHAIKLLEDDCVTDCDVIGNDDKFFLISEYGKGKIIEPSEIMIHHRYRQGVTVMRLTEATGKLNRCKDIRDPEDIVVWTKNNRIIRVAPHQIPKFGRVSGGCTIISLNDNDKVIGVGNAN